MIGNQGRYNCGARLIWLAAMPTGRSHIGHVYGVEVFDREDVDAGTLRYVAYGVRFSTSTGCDKHICAVDTEIERSESQRGESRSECWFA
jgi:hypothetical protein